MRGTGYFHSAPVIVEPDIIRGTHLRFGGCKERAICKKNNEQIRDRFHHASTPSLSNKLPCQRIFAPRCLFTSLERVPLAWNHASDKDALKIKRLEHVLIGKPLCTFPGHALVALAPVANASHISRPPIF